MDDCEKHILGMNFFSFAQNHHKNMNFLEPIFERYAKLLSYIKRERARINTPSQIIFKN